MLNRLKPESRHRQNPPASLSLVVTPRLKASCMKYSMLTWKHTSPTERSPKISCGIPGTDFSTVFLQLVSAQLHWFQVNPAQSYLFFQPESPDSSISTISRYFPLLHSATSLLAEQQPHSPASSLEFKLWRATHPSCAQDLLHDWGVCLKSAEGEMLAVIDSPALSAEISPLFPVHWAAIKKCW